MPGITITINAETAEALSKLEQFFSKVQGGLDTLPSVSHAASEGLAKLRETSMVAKEGFHGLQEAVLLLGGTHMPALIQAVTASRMALLTLRSSALLTGASLAVMTPIIGGVALAVLGGIGAWKSWNAQTEEAHERALKLSAAIKELPRVIGDVKSLIGAGVVSGEQGLAMLAGIGAMPQPSRPGDTPAMQALREQLEFARRHPESQFLGYRGAQLRVQPFEGTPDPDAMRRMQEDLAAQGYLMKSGDEKNPTFALSPQIEALGKLRELQKQLTEEGETGFNKERIAALKTFQDATREAELLGAAAGKFFSSDDLDALKEQIRLQYSWEGERIRFKEQKERDRQAEEGATKRQEELAKQAQEQRQELERKLTTAEATEGEKRGHLYEEDFAARIKLEQELFYSGLTNEKEYTKAVEEATLKRLEGRRREAQEAAQLLKVQEENAKQQLQLQTQMIQQDPYLSQVEKAQQLLPLLQQQLATVRDEQAEVERQMAAPGVSPMERQRLIGQRIGLQGQAAGLGSQIGDIKDAMSVAQQFKRTMVELQNQWGSWAQQLAGSFKSVFDSAISSISSGITGLIIGTRTWAQALMDIGRNILTSIVQAIVQMGVRWVLTQAMMAVAGKTIAASATAALAPIALAQSAIWAAPATLATISSYGAAAAVAPAQIALSEAITYAGALGQFAEGGWTGSGSSSDLAGMVHRNEFVFSAPAVRNIGLGRLQQMHAGGLAGGAGGASGARGPLNLAVAVTDERRAKDLERDPYFQGAVLRIFENNQWRYTRK